MILSKPSLPFPVAPLPPHPLTLRPHFLPGEEAFPYPEIFNPDRTPSLLRLPAMESPVPWAPSQPKRDEYLYILCIGGIWCGDFRFNICRTLPAEERKFLSFKENLRYEDLEMVLKQACLRHTFYNITWVLYNIISYLRYVNTM